MYKTTSDKLLNDIGMSAENIDKVAKEITSAILKPAARTMPRGCRRKYKPFWNKNLDIVVKAKEKYRSKLENNPKTTNRIAFNRTAAEV